MIVQRMLRHEDVSRGLSKYYTLEFISIYAIRRFSFVAIATASFPSFYAICRMRSRNKFLLRLSFGYFDILNFCDYFKDNILKRTFKIIETFLRDFL